MRYGFVFTIGVVLVGLGGTQATAQQPGLPGGPPRVGGGIPPYSPYLNLLRSGNSPGANYYGLVRPQVQARQAISGLQSQVGTNSQALNDLATNSLLPPTDKTVGFMSYGGYFQNFSPAVGIGGVPSAGGGSGVGFGTIGGGRGPIGGGTGRPGAPRR